jgi:hypothetical protein
MIYASGVIENSLTVGWQISLLSSVDSEWRNLSKLLGVRFRGLNKVALLLHHLGSLCAISASEMICSTQDKMKHDCPHPAHG